MPDSSSHNILIAIPSYNQRVSPRFDQAREFHLATVDLRQQRCLQISTQDCSQPPDKICTWLNRFGVHGVICSGIHQKHQLQLHELGIWLTWGISGDIKQVLDHWLEHKQWGTESTPLIPDNARWHATCNDYSL
ncbi:MAG: hypothetical protein J7K75_11660 [Desulfuromonas sp.]|nr:hypothetical protein [Desulfuromonas sp.]